MDPESREPRSEAISYDRLIKTGLRQYFGDVASWLVGAKPIEVRALDPVLTSFAERLADKLLELRFADRPNLLMHVEWQLRGGPHVSKKILQYTALALELLDLPENREKRFLSVVAYLDRKTYREDPGLFRRELYPGKLLTCAYEVVMLWDVDPQPILQANAPGVWPFVPLMKGDPLDLLLRSRRRILDLPDKMFPVERKQDLLTLLGGLATRVIPDRRLLRQLLSEMGNMSENWFIDELIERRRAVVLQKGRDQGLAEGREQGLSEGRAEGRAEGRDEGRKEGAREEARAAIVRILRRRFGSAAEAIGEGLQAIDDLSRLESLVEEAAVAPSLEAFGSFLPEGSA